jgi:hypothetical protein
MDHEPGFWRRQFRVPPTPGQTFWDLLFGIFLPLGCLAADRVIFGNGWLAGHGEDPIGASIFGDLAVLAYTFILTEVGLMTLWLLFRRKLTRSAAFFSGPFLAGWVSALALAMIFFPFSVLGMIFVVGILGFSPWLTCFAFFRNWKMARLLSMDHVSGRKRFWLSVAGIVFVMTPAIALQSQKDHLPSKLARVVATDGGGGK